MEKQEIYTTEIRKDKSIMGEEAIELLTEIFLKLYDFMTRHNPEILNVLEGEGNDRENKE